MGLFMVAMQLPLLLPKQLNYCEKASHDEDLYTLLLKNTPDMILFLESACADETWANRHQDFMKKSLAWLTIQFFQDRLAMDLQGASPNPSARISRLSIPMCR